MRFRRYCGIIRCNWKNRGRLMGGMIDYDKTSELVLRELRGGKLGK